MSKSPNPTTTSRLAVLFPAASDSAVAGSASPGESAAAEIPPPGVPPPDPDPWEAQVQPDVDRAHRGAETRASAAPAYALWRPGPDSLPARPLPAPPPPGHAPSAEPMDADPQSTDRMPARRLALNRRLSEQPPSQEQLSGCLPVVPLPPDPSAADPLPVASRLAATVSDRIPPGLKAFRVAVDGRVVAAVAALALLAIVIAGVGWWRSRPQSVAVPSAVAASGPVAGATASVRSDRLALSSSAATASSADPEAAAASTAPAPTVSVHVVGRVARPGLFTLPSGARVDDALKAAGGALPGTDLAALNLARVLADGEQVPVGVPGATAVPPAALPAPGAPASVATGKGAGRTAVAGAVDLNTATAEQLDSLPGIGPVMAENILDWRRQHGRFTSVDQLREIRGIGERRFEELRLRVRV